MSGTPYWLPLITVGVLVLVGFLFTEALRRTRPYKDDRETIRNTCRAHNCTPRTLFILAHEWKYPNVENHSEAHVCYDAYEKALGDFDTEGPKYRMPRFVWEYLRAHHYVQRVEL